MKYAIEKGTSTPLDHRRIRGCGGGVLRRNRRICTAGSGSVVMVNGGSTSTIGHSVMAVAVTSRAI